MTNIEALETLGILGDVRQRLGAEDEDDTSRDELINEFSVKDCIAHAAGWQLGDNSWGYDIIDNFEQMSKLVGTEKEGSLRVWNIINVPNTPHHYAVTTPREGYDLIQKLAAEQLKNKRIHSNAFGLEVFENGEWTDWNDEEGRDVDEAFEESTAQLKGGAV